MSSSPIVDSRRCQWPIALSLVWVAVIVGMTLFAGAEEKIRKPAPTDDWISKAVTRARDPDSALATRIEALESLSANYLRTAVPLVTSSDRLRDRPSERVLKEIEPLYFDPDLGATALNVAVSFRREAGPSLNRSLAKSKSINIVGRLVEANCGLEPNTIPVVQAMLKQPLKRTDSIDCLIALKNTGVAADAVAPSLRDLVDLHNKGPLRVRTFGSYGSQADNDLMAIQTMAIRTLVAVSKDQKGSVPFVVKTMMEHRFIEVRLAALESLGTLGPNAKDAVPELRKLLTQYETAKDRFGPDKIMIARMIIGVLGSIGPGAADSIPELRRFLKDESLGKAAEGAIQRIKAK